MLEADQDEYVLQKIKQSFVENHVSYVYEEVCRESMWRMPDKGFSFNCVGRWWGKASAVMWKNRERKEYFILFSKSGFDKELEEYAKEHTNIYLCNR